MNNQTDIDDLQGVLVKEHLVIRDVESGEVFINQSHSTVTPTQDEWDD